MRAVVTAFLVGLIAGAYAEDTTEAPKFSELLDFLNTTDKIWTYLQSISNTPMCISRTKESLSPTDYKCNLCTGYPTQSCQEENASLKSGTQYPEMVVTKEGATPITYSFKYFNTNEYCGIFTFESNGETQCEMRVWNSQVSHSEGTDCEKGYDKYCQRKHKVYQSQCQSESS